MFLHFVFITLIIIVGLLFTDIHFKTSSLYLLNIVNLICLLIYIIIKLMKIKYNRNILLLF